MWLWLSRYMHTCIRVKRTITIPNTAAAGAVRKNCIPVSNCKSKINNTQVDDSHDIDVLMTM